MTALTLPVHPKGIPLPIVRAIDPACNPPVAHTQHSQTLYLRECRRSQFQTEALEQKRERQSLHPANWTAFSHIVACRTRAAPRWTVEIGCPRLAIGGYRCPCAVRYPNWHKGTDLEVLKQRNAEGPISCGWHSEHKRNQWIKFLLGVTEARKPLGIAP